MRDIRLDIQTGSSNIPPVVLSYDFKPWKQKFMEESVKKIFQLVPITLIFLMLFVCIGFAGGYQLNEQSARATGMGGAFVARASDPSAIYFNPAGLGFQKGLDFMGGATLSFPSTEFSGPAPLTEKTTTKWQVLTTANFYGTCTMSPDVVVGLGIYSPYEFGIEWPDTWVGKQVTTKSNLHTLSFNPSVGYRVNDQLSLGFGASYVYATYYLLMNPRPNYTNSMELDLSGNGFNINFGALYKPIEGLSVGLSYRTKTDIKFSGEAKTFGMRLPAGTWLSGPATTKLPMPGNLLVGAAYDVLPDLTIEIDFQFIQWSTYNQLNIEIPKAQIGQSLAIDQLDTIITGIKFPPVSIGQGVLSSDKKWDDGYIGRLGIEYQYSEDLTIRGGLIYDITPQPESKTDPINPDGNKIDITLGAGYKMNEQISLNVGYMFTTFEDRTSQVFPQGSYKSMSHVVSIDVSYSF
jgi:long-chain fatty acid transport protein